MESAPEEWNSLLASWSRELAASTDRINYLIQDRHRPTEGGYREMLLRRLLRRVLPDRFRVSTGFIYQWGRTPSRQIDILIWDAQNHSALLEEGELAILAADAVDAIIEVKSNLRPRDLSDALDILTPPWWVQWCHTDATSKTGLTQQVDGAPFRGVFAYTSRGRDANASSRMIFEQLTSFYRQRFREDARNVFKHSGRHAEWTNLVDVVCVADSIQVEQTRLTLRSGETEFYSGPAFIATNGRMDDQSLSVGRFCMSVLGRLTRWTRSDPAHMTLGAPTVLASPGVCCFVPLPESLTAARLWGTDTPLGGLWSPKEPLWSLDEGGN